MCSGCVQDDSVHFCGQKPKRGCCGGYGESTHHCTNTQVSKRNLYGAEAPSTPGGACGFTHEVASSSSRWYASSRCGCAPGDRHAPCETPPWCNRLRYGVNLSPVAASSVCPGNAVAGQAVILFRRHEPRLPPSDQNVMRTEAALRVAAPW